MNFVRVASGAATLALAFACQMSAAPVTGTFDIAGTVTVNDSSTITWMDNLAPPHPNKALIGSTDLSGAFVGLGGTEVTIDNLNAATEPVGTVFTPQPFISFDANAALGTLMIDYIYPGIYPAAGCLASPPAPGQTCTPGPPITSAASPFNFVNNPPPSSPGATASWVLAGVTSGGYRWVGNFTSQFNVPFQTVLATLAGAGSVSNTYSATFTVTTPEPESIFLMLRCLLLVAGPFLKKKLL